jgi:hypothetical protein
VNSSETVFVFVGAQTRKISYKKNVQQKWDTYTSSVTVPFGCVIAGFPSFWSFVSYSVETLGNLNFEFLLTERHSTWVLNQHNLFVKSPNIYYC